MRDAALVGRAWKDAALQVTTELEASITPSTAAGLQTCVQQHGKQLVSMRVTRTHGYVGPAPRLDLPWTSLSRLQVLILKHVSLPEVTTSTDMKLDDGSSNSRSRRSSRSIRPTPLLPNLQQLELKSCSMPSVDTFMQLAASTALTSLKAYDGWMTFDNIIGKRYGVVAEAVLSLLQHQRQLRVLRISASWFSSLWDFSTSPPTPIITPLAAMHQLQDLCLSFPHNDHYENGFDDRDSMFDGCLDGLPPSLTCLHLHLSDSCNPCWGDSQVTLPPAQQQLSLLQHLQLYRIRLAPSVLRDMPALTHLELSECILLPCDDLDMPNNTPKPEAVGALMQSVLALTSLQHLELREMQLEKAPAASFSQFSALTFCPQRTALIIYQRHTQPLASAAVGCGLHVSCTCTVSVADADPELEETHCISENDLAHIMRSCPGLKSLDVTDVWACGRPVMCSQTCTTAQKCTSLIRSC